MANCITTIKQISFDFTDEQITQVRINTDFEGDCPVNMKRVYEKAFPARFSAKDIMTMDGGVGDYLLW